MNLIQFINKAYKKVKRELYCLVNNKKLKVMSSEETIKLILEKNLSIGRFGDGELAIMNGKSISFQEFDGNLAAKLQGIKSTNSFLVCIPKVFDKKSLNAKDIRDFDYKFWEEDLKYRRHIWIKFFKDCKPLGDSFISRFYLRYKNRDTDSYVKLLKKLWDGRDIVFVEGEKSRLGVGNDLFDNAKSFERIICPSENGFRKYDEILAFVKENVSKEKLLILAIGPTATVLSYNLSADGFQSLDLGHVDVEYEWFRMGVDKKVPVKCKYVNEVEDGKTPEEVQNDGYYNQIIKRIL